VEHRYVATIEAPREAVFTVLADIGTYDRWLETVHRVEPDPDGGAWFFVLRAQIGPFARSKRLRVVETAGEESARVRLERHERDGRDHAPWIFEASLSDGQPIGSTAVALTLSYGGRLWTSALSTVLDGQLRSATERLQAIALADG
jgi:uncharacterized protein YndB with AHSA1/START domain